MSELRKLECLYAQHNDIKELPEFIGCDSLREIHLSNNFITVSFRLIPIINKFKILF